MTRTTTRWLGFLCGAVLMLVGASSAHAHTAQEIAKKAFGSTVLLVMEDADGQPLSLGSGGGGTDSCTIRGYRDSVFQRPTGRSEQDRFLIGDALKSSRNACGGP